MRGRDGGPPVVGLWEYAGVLARIVVSRVSAAPCRAEIMEDFRLGGAVSIDAVANAVVRKPVEVGARRNSKDRVKGDVCNVVGNAATESALCEQARRVAGEADRII